MVSSRGNLGHLTLSQHLARASKIMKRWQCVVFLRKNLTYRHLAGAGGPGFIPGSKAAFL